MTPEEYGDAILCLTVLGLVLSVTALVAGYALGVCRWKSSAREALAHLFHAGQVNAALRERLRQAEAAGDDEEEGKEWRGLN